MLDFTSSSRQDCSNLGLSGLESRSNYALHSSTSNKISFEGNNPNSGLPENKDNYDSMSGRESKSSYNLAPTSAGSSSRDRSASFSKRNSKELQMKEPAAATAAIQSSIIEPKEAFEVDSVKDGFDSSRGGGDGLSSVNSKEDLDKLNPVFSPMGSSRDTIDPPDLFNTNKKQEPSNNLELPKSETAAAAGSKQAWTNEKTYSSQTLSRRHKTSSHSHTSRSKRLRNRSLEMVLDNDTNSADSSAASKSDPSRSKHYSRSLERPKPRRADRYVITNQI